MRSTSAPYGRVGSFPEPFGANDLRTHDGINDYNGLGSREGWLPDPSPPPLIPENPFSVLGCGRIFLLFSKVIAVGLLSAVPAVDPEMVL